ncbi:MAG: transposase [Opitutaceae bacterium]|nr:transposase [Opitutaceae bacterium]
MSTSSFSKNPRRQTAELRKGRLSLVGARYFVTFATARRASALASPSAIAAAHLVCQRLVDDCDITALTATIMPDHVHLLFELGGTLTLDRVVAKWRTLVRRAVPGLTWQANFFEHRLSADELSEPYAWCVFMNPYRAGLIRCDALWPGWWTDGAVSHEFLALARPGPCPQPEWLDQVDERARGLILGE